MESTTKKRSASVRRGQDFRNSLQVAGASAVSRREARGRSRCGMSVELTLEGVCLNYRQGAATTVALEDVTLSVEHEEFVTIVGASGCGKSSLLNLVAGFLRHSRGQLLLGGDPIVGPGADRCVVFQEHALFPWMTVRQNVGYGLRVNGVSRAKTRERVDELLSLIGLSKFADSWPKALSGGMKQRVAIARALANRPKMLLMDEPFAALDAQTRRFLQDELLNIWQQTGTTILFVTHSIEEAVLLADRVVVLTSRPGRVKEIVKIDLPRPRDENSVSFVGFRRRVADLLQEEIRESQLLDKAAG
jgi:NitT/TauT family transport system ATP-binding protein